ncbi:TIGR01244 family sulfur transferase, partial [uncultured Maricaulis sp.]|uniref:TIGR01244 family sulfur transferase n=1 Tax=uncultured Maricaulis sp. TaxID=174710 RepID=UPI0030D6FD12
MEIRTIAPDLSVSPQLQPEDVATAAAQGFKSLILNRPDGESGDQPSREAIEDAAGQHGLKLRYVPVIAGDLKDADVTAFSAAMRELPTPALAFCRTGTRSATLWALSQAGHLSTEAILDTTQKAGY